MIRTPSATPCTAAYRRGQAAAHPHCYTQHAQSHTARSGGVSLYLPETAALVYTTIAPMMPGLDNHLVEMHRDLRCARSRNRSWCALPMRRLCWPRAGVCRAGEGRRGRANTGVMAVWPHVCLNTMECQQLVFVGLVVSTFGASAVAAGRRHQQCQLLPQRRHSWPRTPNADSACACLCP